MLVKPLMTNFKIIPRVGIHIYACNTFPLYKSLYLIVLRSLALDRQLSSATLSGFQHKMGSTHLPASNIKQTFLSTNLSFLSPFKCRAAGPRSHNILMVVWGFV